MEIQAAFTRADSNLKDPVDLGSEGGASQAPGLGRHASQSWLFPWPPRPQFHKPETRAQADLLVSARGSHCSRGAQGCDVRGLRCPGSCPLLKIPLFISIHLISKFLPRTLPCPNCDTKVNIMVSVPNPPSDIGCWTYTQSL